MLRNTPNIHIDESYDGNSALLKFKEKNYDFVFMDLHMPVKDGYETAREMKKININCSLIAVSGYDGQVEKNKSFEYGFDAFVTKPL